MNTVLVPAGRLSRWVDNFAVRHGQAALSVASGGLHGEAADGSSFSARLPFDRTHDGVADVAHVVEAARPPAVWGVVLVRKGGFAVARLEGATMVEHKVGQRHVQGRTKAGGQSQQRFARRRDNQARQAYEAAAEHAARILAGSTLVVTGGDHAAVEVVLADPRLAGLRVVGEWQAVGDPRRAVLDKVVLDAQCLVVEVHNADAGVR